MGIKLWQLMLMIFLVYFVVLEYWNDPTVMVSSGGSTEIYTRHGNILTPTEFKDLAAFVLSSPVTQDMQASMRSSRGREWSRVSLLLRFNDKGLRDYCRVTDKTPICNFINKIKLDEANAWLLKVFVGLPSNYSTGESMFESQLPIQGGGPLKLRDHRYTWVPHETSIFDIQAPSDMDGGELEVYQDQRKDMKKPAEISRGGAAHIVRSAGNTMHVLSGSSWYTWTDFSVPQPESSAKRESESEQDRVSLILEQYAVPKEEAFQAVQLEEELGSKAPPPDHQDEIILFTFLSGCLGGLLGVLVQRGAEDSERGKRIIIGAFSGFFLGGVSGGAISISGLYATKNFWRLLAWFMLFTEENYFHTPDTTRIVVFSAFLTIVWISFLLLARLLVWSEVMGGGKYDEESFFALFTGEKASDVKISKRESGHSGKGQGKEASGGKAAPSTEEKKKQ